MYVLIVYTFCNKKKFVPNKCHLPNAESKFQFNLSEFHCTFLSFVEQSYFAANFETNKNAKHTQFILKREDERPKR